MLLCSKGTVVSDLLKAADLQQQVCIGKTRESEPCDDSSKCQDVVKSGLGMRPVMSKAETCLRSLRQPAKSWRESNTGAYSEREKLNIDVKENDK
jgi:hypothetical protein